MPGCRPTPSTSLGPCGCVSCLFVRPCFKACVDCLPRRMAVCSPALSTLQGLPLRVSSREKDASSLCRRSRVDVLVMFVLGHLLHACMHAAACRLALPVLRYCCGRCCSARANDVVQGGPVELVVRRATRPAPAVPSCCSGPLLGRLRSSTWNRLAGLRRYCNTNRSRLHCKALDRSFQLSRHSFQVLRRAVIVP